jgi:ABC-type multidrug transport system permease subunit
MGAAWSIVKLDVRGILRDQVALATVLLSLVGTLIIAGVGAWPGRPEGWARWFPLVVAVSLVGGPAGFGFLFGLLMVDEGDTGVRRALAVTPVRPEVFLLVRTVVATAWMAVWPLASVYLMNWTWRALDLTFLHWLAVVMPLALFTPAFTLVIPSLADDKVGALAVFKALSFLSLVPLALFFVPAGAWYRRLLLISPTGWIVEAYRAFLDAVPSAGRLWALGGALYAAVLLAAVVILFTRKVYRL